MLSRNTITTINDWVKWFNYHADKVSTYPPDKQMVWMLKAINGAYECMSKIGNEVNASGRPMSGFERGSNGLLIPQTWRFNGPQR